MTIGRVFSVWMWMGAAVVMAGSLLNATVIAYTGALVIAAGLGFALGAYIGFNSAHDEDVP